MQPFAAEPSAVGEATVVEVGTVPAGTGEEVVKGWGGGDGGMGRRDRVRRWVEGQGEEVGGGTG